MKEELNSLVGQTVYAVKPLGGTISISWLGSLEYINGVYLIMGNPSLAFNETDVVGITPANDLMMVIRLTS